MYRTTTRTPKQIAERGHRICAIDETIPAVRKTPGSDARPLHKRTAPNREAAFHSSAPSVVAASVVPVATETTDTGASEPNPFESDPVFAVKELAKHDAALELLRPETRKALMKSLTAFVRFQPELWESFPMGTKRAIGIFGMAWYVDPAEPNVATCESIHSENLYAVTFDPATGETACQKHTHNNPKTGKWEGGCTAFCTGKMCYHRLVFDAVVRTDMIRHFEGYYPHLLGDWHRAETTNSETESEHRQEQENRVECPRCEGKKQSFAMWDGRDAKTGKAIHGSGMVDCSTCEGTGFVSQERAAAIAWGAEIRAERIARKVGGSEEAKRLGVDPIELNAVEYGRASSAVMQKVRIARQSAALINFKGDF